MEKSKTSVNNIHARHRAFANTQCSCSASVYKGRAHTTGNNGNALNVTFTNLNDARNNFVAVFQFFSFFSLTKLALFDFASIVHLTMFWAQVEVPFTNYVPINPSCSGPTHPYGTTVLVTFACERISLRAARVQCVAPNVYQETGINKIRV